MSSADLWYDVQNATIHNGITIDSICYLLQNLSLNLKQRFVAMCWSLWKHQNLKVREDVNEISATVVDKAKVLIDDWLEANVPQP